MRIRLTVQSTLTALSLIALVFASGCSSSYERSEKPTGDWSRGVLLGQSNVRQRVTMEIDEARTAHLAWIEPQSDETPGIHYAQIDRTGRVTIDRRVSTDLSHPRDLQLLPTPEGSLGLSFLSRQDDDYTLFHARLDPIGELTEPTALSREDENVLSYQLVRSGPDEIQAIWASELEAGQSGIYRRTLGSTGFGEPFLLVPGGRDPFILIDDSDSTSTPIVYMVWTIATGFTSREIYFAILDGGSWTPPRGQRITAFEFAESATYEPPVVGLESERVYIAWSVQNLGGGLTPTAADTFYVSFPADDVAYADPENLKLPTDHRPRYADHTGPYGISQLRPLSTDVYGTDFVNAPAVVRSREAELPMAVSVIIESASKQFMQLAVTMLKSGQPVGYQIANETPNASVLPTLATDEERNLHLAWLDTAGFRRFNVYYATTAPEAKVWLDRTTVDDVGQRAASLAWGVLSAVGFMPLTLMWNAPALVWLVIFYLAARQEHLDELGAKIAVVISIIVYLGVKTLFLPGLLSAGTPFVYVVPQEWIGALNTIVPLAILTLALLGIIIYVIRARSQGGEPATMFKAYLVFALIDSLLTAILYAPRFFDPRG